MFMISESKSFIPQILKVVIPLTKKLIFFNHLGFEIQKNYDSETLAFKFDSFRVFQRYLTDDQNARHSRRTVSVFQSSARSF